MPEYNEGQGKNQVNKFSLKDAFSRFKRREVPAVEQAASTPTQQKISSQEVIQKLESQGRIDRYTLQSARRRFANELGISTNEEGLIDLYKAVAREQHPSGYRIAEIILSEQITSETLRDFYRQGTGADINLPEDVYQAINEVHRAISEQHAPPFGVVVRVDEHMHENSAETNPIIRNFADFMRNEINGNQIMITTFSNNEKAIPREMRINNPFLGTKQNQATGELGSS